LTKINIGRHDHRPRRAPPVFIQPVSSRAASGRLATVCAGLRRALDIGVVEDRSWAIDANPRGQNGRRAENVRTGDQRLVCRAAPKPVLAQL